MREVRLGSYDFGHSKVDACCQILSRHSKVREEDGPATVATVLYNCAHHIGTRDEVLLLKYYQRLGETLRW